MTEEYTTLIPDFSGTCIVYAHCENCGQAVQYPAERPYNCCPYCFARVRYKEEYHGN